MTERPEYIMINVPEAFFRHEGKIMGDREMAFRKFYEGMGSDDPIVYGDCFYHFISTIPTHWKNLIAIYVCFRGFVQYKAIIVDFLKNQPVMLETYQHPDPRNWVITTGPVEKAPPGMIQKGFRGFRYTHKLF
jgi:hypothetical protein